MIKAIDFFCGAGGLTRGLLDAGIEVLAGVDVDGRLRPTYETNNAPSRFVCQDIKDIDIGRLRQDLCITQKDLVLYAACCPCQPFSTLNQMKGKDDRKELLISFAEIVEKAPPDFILVENVPGLNTAYGKDIYDRFVEILKKAGFKELYSAFLNAQDFGVPQVRKRFILLASRHGSVCSPRRSSHKPNVQDAIKKYPPITDGVKSDQFHNHETRKLMPHHKVIVQAIPKNGGSRRDVADTSIELLRF